ncbi:MAG: hypothetical protein H5U40_18195 [Polyangiaceae bacterium]|nr:hypothetical protein [Polyangiaceae bacterium]
MSVPVGLVESTWGISLESEHWPDTLLFSTLEPGGPPPVLAVREFHVKRGTTCPALGGATMCSDIFHAYYEPVP